MQDHPAKSSNQAGACNRIPSRRFTSTVRRGEVPSPEYLYTKRCKTIYQNHLIKRAHPIEFLWRSRRDSKSREPSGSSPGFTSTIRRGEVPSPGNLNTQRCKTIYHLVKRAHPIEFPWRSRRDGKSREPSGSSPGFTSTIRRGEVPSPGNLNTKRCKTIYQNHLIKRAHAIEFPWRSRRDGKSREPSGSSPGFTSTIRRGEVPSPGNLNTQRCKNIQQNHLIKRAHAIEFPWRSRRDGKSREPSGSSPGFTSTIRRGEVPPPGNPDTKRCKNIQQNHLIKRAHAIEFPWRSRRDGKSREPSGSSPGFTSTIRRGEVPSPGNLNTQRCKTINLNQPSAQMLIDCKCCKEVL